jgi:hypothetical protein
MWWRVAIVRLGSHRSTSAMGSERQIFASAPGAPTNCKSDLSYEELIEFCRSVLSHHEQ